MKRIIILTVLIAYTSMWGCDKDTEGVSKITSYPEIVLEKGPLIAIDLGTSYTEPGYKAYEDVTDITDKVQTSGTVDPNVEGLNKISYSAKNTQGFESTVVREVYVQANNINVSAEDISGTYTSNISRSSGGSTTSRGPFEVTVTKVVDGYGLFAISDFLGGWYQYGSGYGSAYAGSGSFVLTGNNEIEVFTSSLEGWEDTISLFDTSTYDPATKTIVIKSIMDSSSSMQFTVTMVLKD